MLPDLLQPPVPCSCELYASTYFQILRPSLVTIIPIVLLPSQSMSVFSTVLFCAYTTSLLTWFFPSSSGLYSDGYPHFKHPTKYLFFHILPGLSYIPVSVLFYPGLWDLQQCLLGFKECLRSQGLASFHHLILYYSLPSRNLSTHPLFCLKNHTPDPDFSYPPLGFTVLSSQPSYRYYSPHTARSILSPTGSTYTSLHSLLCGTRLQASTRSLTPASSLIQYPFLFQSTSRFLTSTSTCRTHCAVCIPMLLALPSYVLPQDHIS